MGAALVSVTDIRSFIDDYFRAWEGTDEERILSYYSESVAVAIPGMVLEGKAALRDQFVRPFVAAFPGNRHVVKNMVFGKDVVAVEWNFQGLHSGPFAGRAATGAAIEVPGCGVYELDPLHRKITAARIYLELTTLLNQISSRQPQVLRDLLIAWFALRTVQTPMIKGGNGLT
ncbi:MAG: nuclear transport factor 2 family protein [Sinobacteraceae bacterium]|nr:nuclear transport factor 2 family protein [Nevskiaceae bacterium]